MYALISAAFDRSRAVIMVFLFLLIMGSVAYTVIPKESDPDVPIPMAYVVMTHDGISPEDAERLLIQPMEKELQSLEGLKEMRSDAHEGSASIILEFDAGFDADKALDDVREKVDLAKAELPADTDEPIVEEINVALFPVLSISLAGPIAEQELLHIAKDIKDRLEAIPSVLEVVINGEREEQLEILVEPVVMETYGLDYADLFRLVSNNNRLVAAGALDTGAGRMVLKVPGLIEDLDDMLSMPIKVQGDTVVTFADVATIRRSFKDPSSFARVDGQPALILEVKKRIGANIIETVTNVKQIVETQQLQWPESLRVQYHQDKSKETVSMLADLQNNVISAIILVMVVIIAILGVRPAFLVGLSIPGAFLTGILVIYMMGYTLNIVVLFSLILVVGMLVDGAIVVSDLAERQMALGASSRSAFIVASKRMAWPVIASTATTLAVFVPLTFWPGVIGGFMKYLPITVLVCLIASLFMALVFIPVLGGAVGRSDRKPGLDNVLETDEEVSSDANATPFVRAYLNVLSIFLARPLLTLFAALAALILAYFSYISWGKGVEFFPEVEPEFAQVQIRARGDLSIYEKDAIVRRVESRLLDMTELESIYSTTFNRVRGENLPSDTVGVVQLQFVDWEARRPAADILEEMRSMTADMPGIKLDFRKADNGPVAGKPIQLQLSSNYPDLLLPAVEVIQRQMVELGGFVDIEDTRPLPGIEWRIEVDREQAARFGADISLLGNAVQMITSGIKLADYRPEDADDELDIRVRFPLQERHLDQLKQLHVPSNRGMVPITNFIQMTPAPKTTKVSRIDGSRTLVIKSDIAPGVLADEQLKRLKEAMATVAFDPRVKVAFKGEDEEQREAMVFLSTAFIIAIFLMLLILVLQFNSFYQSFLVLSAIVFSTAGVLLGLLMSGQTFGVVMVGVGIISLAGVVVNNNIVLIDTYNQIRRSGMAPVSAALQTGALRLRPVLLTAVTTVLGLMPMVLALNIDLINRAFSIGAPSTQWWIQLATSIAGGLSFATLLTLFLTPCMLVLGESKWFRRRESAMK